MRLATLARSVIQSEEDEAISQIEILDKDIDNQWKTIVVTNIHSVEAVQAYLFCLNCSKRLLQASACNIMRCDKCRFTMRTVDCTKKNCVKLVFQIEDSQQLHLTAFQETLEPLIPNITTLSEMDIAEALLLLNNLKVSYSSDTSMISELSEL